jgi:hypothetical protein
MAEPARLYTLDEANAALDAVRSLVRAMQADKRRLDVARERLAQLTPAMRDNGHGADAQALEVTTREALLALRAGIAELNRRGIELKDLDNGLLDFPSIRDGRVVYLCWLIDEPTIAHWHELGAGFAGRQAL